MKDTERSFIDLLERFGWTFITTTRRAFHTLKKGAIDMRLSFSLEMCFYTINQDTLVCLRSTDEFLSSDIEPGLAVGTLCNVNISLVRFRDLFDDR